MNDEEMNLYTARFYLLDVYKSPTLFLTAAALIKIGI